MKFIINLSKWVGIVAILYGSAIWAFGGFLPVGTFSEVENSSGFYKVVAVESSYWTIAAPLITGSIFLGLSVLLKYVNSKKQSLSA